MQGSVLGGRYRLEESIGSGGMGTVWRASDEVLHREVAVKVLSLREGVSEADRTMLRARFRQEALAAARLDSPHIVTIYDHGTEELPDGSQLPFLVMPLISGRTLSAVMADGPMEPERVREAAVGMTRALEVAHRAGVVHRDVKPANVMVQPNGNVVMLDFGIAKVLESTTASGALTTTGSAPFGTLPYMAPERFLNKPVDARSDLYSLGCVLYQLLAGELPFVSDSAPSLMYMHLNAEPRPLPEVRPELAAELVGLVGAMLAKEPERRPTAAEAVGALEALAGRLRRPDAGGGTPAPAVRMDKPMTQQPAMGAIIPPPPGHLPGQQPGMGQHPANQHPATPHPAARQSYPSGPVPFNSPSTGATQAGPSPFNSGYPPPPGGGAGGVGGPGGMSSLPPVHLAGTSRTRRNALVTVIAVATAAALTATVLIVDPFGEDSKGGGGKHEDEKRERASRSQDWKLPSGPVALGTAADSKGPTAPMAGAKRGGRATGMEYTAFSHLDPARMYFGTEIALSSLFARTLTTIKSFPDGSRKLVGDLATDSGKSTDGGKTWTFVLKPGLKYEDGTPIVSGDFKYAVQRQFRDYVSEGPNYLPLWTAGFDFRKKYKEQKWESTGLPDSLISTPDDRTVVFHLQSRQPELNFAVSLPVGSPVPKAKDTGPEYDRKPFSSGPYRIAESTIGKSMKLERNPAWDASTDPVRAAYPDGYDWEFGVTNEQADQRIVSGAGRDAQAFSLTNPISPATRARVKSDPELQKRLLDGPSSYVTWFSINTSRVRDLKVRRAIIKAFPKEQARLADGGPMMGDFAKGVISPNNEAYRPYNLFDTKPQGDPAAARKLLQEAGKLGYKVVFPYSNNGINDRRAAVIKEGLERAGFKVELKSLETLDYYNKIGKVKNQYDLYWSGWQADWPTGSSAVQPPFDGRLIQDSGTNYSHLNDPTVNRKIDEATAETDPKRSVEKWAEVDKAVMRQAPVVPYLYRKDTRLYGSGLGGVFQNSNGTIDPSRIWIR